MPLSDVVNKLQKEWNENFLQVRTAWLEKENDKLSAKLAESLAERERLEKRLAMYEGWVTGRRTDFFLEQKKISPRQTWTFIGNDAPDEKSVTTSGSRNVFTSQAGFYFQLHKGAGDFETDNQALKHDGLQKMCIFGENFSKSYKMCRVGHYSKLLCASMILFVLESYSPLYIMYNIWTWLIRYCTGCTIYSSGLFHIIPYRSS